MNKYTTLQENKKGNIPLGYYRYQISYRLMIYISHWVESPDRVSRSEHIYTFRPLVVVMLHEILTPKEGKKKKKLLLANA